MYKFTLENNSKKHNCPNCNAKRFVRYVRTSGGGYLNDAVGKCDRESSCAFHYTPKEFFKDNLHLDEWKNRKETGKKQRKGREFYAVKVPVQRIQPAPIENKKNDYIPKELLFDTLGNYKQNNFIHFLLKLFPNDAATVKKAVIDYSIGTFRDYAVFPNITRSGKVAQAKLMKFDALTGKRLKTDKFSISSLPYELRRQGKINKDFETDKTVFFGEHLTKVKSKTICIVEAQKTAVICSILLPEKLWIASGSKSFVKVAKLKKFRRCEIILYPDADGFDLWTETARLARLEGLDVKTSALIERNATTEQKAAGIDLADYLIAEQLENQIKPLETVKGQQNHNSYTMSELKTETPQISVKEFITRLQLSGVEFYISSEFFEIGGRTLTGIERENLQKQSGSVLCHLQQAALNKFIFKPFPELRKQFKFEVNERVGIISETEQPGELAHYLAVRQTAFFWFHDYFSDGVFNQL